MMSVEQSVELGLAGKTEVLGENLPTVPLQRHDPGAKYESYKMNTKTPILYF
jgi:hypothetical protein